MAKKRKVSTLPTIRSKEMKEVRETNEDSNQPPEGNDGMSEHPEKVSTAREHLKTVLQELLVVSDDSSEELLEEKEEKEVKEKEEEPPKPKEVKKEKTPSIEETRLNKKRRRRMKAKEAQFHHTYVMKLFDRSVDLAQFTEDTPLYPICRAWMANQPRNGAVVKSRKRATTPDLEEEDEEKDVDSDKSKVKNMYKLPPPVPFPSDLVAQRKLRIPSPIPYQRAKEIEMDLEVKPSREILLRAHVTRWTAIRKKWHATGHRNEARFADSAGILRNIYKQAQTSFECA